VCRDDDHRTWALRDRVGALSQAAANIASAAVLRVPAGMSSAGFDARMRRVELFAGIGAGAVAWAGLPVLVAAGRRLATLDYEAMPHAPV
jgi:hypothetical protein